MRKRLLVRDRIVEIVDGLRVGDPIPAERRLCADLGVARATVRDAIADLVRAGRLERRQGSGTYVAAPKEERRPGIESFTRTAREAGHVPASRTLDAELRPAGAQLGRRLELSPGDAVLVFRRLRLADGVPMAIETLHVPERVAPGLTGDDLERHSFYELLDVRYGIRVGRGHQAIEPTVIDASESEVLGVPALSPAFLFELTTRSRDDVVVEFNRSVHRGDRFRLAIDLGPGDLPRYEGLDHFRTTG